MNQKSRERAIKAIAERLYDDIGDPPLAALDHASEILDALIADGAHVAYWRKVEEADKDGEAKLVQSSHGEGIQSGCYEIECDNWWLDSVERFCLENEKVMVMDLPGPPETDGDE